MKKNKQSNDGGLVYSTNKELMNEQFAALAHLSSGENESVVEFLMQKFELKILHMEYIVGYEMQADTMFVAVLSY